MGVIYFVVCTECKVVRDLDKFYQAHSIRDRKEALILADEIKEIGNFRCGLLASFMAEHMGHKCIMFTDSHDYFYEEYCMDESGEYSEDTDFWKEQP